MRRSHLFTMILFLIALVLYAGVNLHEKLIKDHTMPQIHMSKDSIRVSAWTVRCGGGMAARRRTASCREEVRRRLSSGRDEPCLGRAGLGQWRNTPLEACRMVCGRPLRRNAFRAEPVAANPLHQPPFAGTD